MRQSYPDIERHLSATSADLRRQMAEMRKLRVALKEAEALFGGNAHANRHRISPQFRARFSEVRSRSRRGVPT
jgi:hypothetical protein